MKQKMRLGLWIGVLFGWFGWLEGQVPKFRETYFDFGQIKEEGGKMEHIFWFVNAGTKPLLLVEAKPSCGCTEPNWMKSPVLPGDSGWVRAIYNPVGHPGAFAKTITLRWEGLNDPTVLRIIGNVVPRPKGPKELFPFEDGSIRFKTQHFTLGEVYPTDIPVETTILFNQGKKPIHFSAQKSSIPPHIKLKMSKSTLNSGDTLTLWMRYDTPKKKDWGPLTESLILATDDPERPMKTLQVSLDIVEWFGEVPAPNPPRIRVEPMRFSFGQIPQGEKVKTTFVIENFGKSPLIIRKVFAPCSCISTKLGAQTLAPGEKTNLEVTFNSSGKADQQVKEIRIIANDPSKPELELEIEADVKVPE